MNLNGTLLPSSYKNLTKSNEKKHFNLNEMSVLYLISSFLSFNLNEISALYL